MTAIGLLIVACSPLIAQPALINPVGQNAAELPADAPLEKILEALHARGGANLQDFVADVSMAETDSLTGDVTTLIGKVWYQNVGQGNSRFRVVFDKKLVNYKPVRDFKLEFLLDKGWLVERDHKRKLEISRQVLRPGQKMDPLKLGEGPFPLPIGQEPKAVREMFEVKKLEVKEGEPTGTLHIQLVPKPGTQFERRFKSIDVWVDQKSHFPRRITTPDRNDTSTKVTDLTNVQVNQNIGDKPFALEELKGEWDRKSEPLGQ
jgi:hypothetical protein